IPPGKKAPASLPVPISPPFAAFCVSCVFASYHHQRTAQIRTATATRRIAKAAALVKSRLAGVSTSIPFIMDNLKKNLLYFPTRIFSVLTTHNFLFDVKTKNPGLFQQPGFCFFIYCPGCGIWLFHPWLYCH